MCFEHFDLEMCFAPQRRAIFHLSFSALIHWKNTVNRDFPTFLRTCIFLLLTLSLLWSSHFFSSHFFSSPPWLFPPLLFHLSILSEVWLLNFLRLIFILSLPLFSRRILLSIRPIQREEWISDIFWWMRSVVMIQQAITSSKQIWLAGNFLMVNDLGIDHCFCLNCQRNLTGGFHIVGWWMKLYFCLVRPFFAAQGVSDPRHLRSTRHIYIYLYYIILHYIILYYITLYYFKLYYLIAYFIVLYYIILNYTKLYHLILYHTILFHIILYYITLYHIIICYIILYYILFYYIYIYIYTCTWYIWLHVHVHLIYLHTHIYTHIYIYLYIYININIYIYIHTHAHNGSQAARQTARQTDGQT